jgi:ribonuclease D
MSGSYQNVKRMPENTSKFNSEISKEEIKQLESSAFEGDIYIVNDQEGAVIAARELANYPVLGFDTETKPSFKKGQVFEVSLLQLSIPGKAFLFRILLCGIPDLLKQVLEDENIIKTGVAIHDDLKKLRKIRDFIPGGFVDLQKFSSELGIESNGLRKLAAIVLGIRISKNQQLTNWESEELTEAQAIYAATDAWVSYEIYEKLMASLAS